ncbi:MAG: tRNA uridine(34) 5-carboxymethylaminomethyl modification radical SAM/GNAT enzyme Elp3 [Thermoplasmata archaeon]|nr:tRNA uridine(34) 5-carboxymethylaminomethyl modification radical SAM/GNAT enzyme Elp3 [Thermoplasmata archaeon]
MADPVGQGAFASTDATGSTPELIHRQKLAWMREHPGGPVPSNLHWIERLADSERARLPAGARRKPTRSLSGVAVVAVMTSPAACPHGRCTYCPGGVELRAPQSYTGEEPSALRGAQFGYDPRAITEHRLKVLESIGHSTSKVEVIVMGGTLPSRGAAYQSSVFQGIYDGLNGTSSPTLESAQQQNETAARRLVSLTVETRPDWCDERVLPSLLAAGVTRVEIGVECLHDDVLQAVGRAHGSGEVVAATRSARSRGLKVCYHLMVGLPGMNPASDFEDFRRLFDEPEFRPDMLKIYPTLVLPGTPLYESWKVGEYTPYDTATAVDLLARMKSIVPPWVRIQRIQRDIPARLIAAGVRTSNVRQLAQRRLQSEGHPCRCLRCREAGRDRRASSTSYTMNETRYAAAGGEECFLVYEDKATDTIAGFIRLRFASVGDGSQLPIVRELKVVGTEVAVGSSPSGQGSMQHRGFGRSLLARAEELAREAGFDGLRVLSAVGTREYYRKFDYHPDGPYMTKRVFAGRKESTRAPVAGGNS